MYKLIKNVYRFLNPRFQNVFLEYKVDVSPRYGHGKPAHGDLLAIIEKYDDEYKVLLQNCLKYKIAFHDFKDMKNENNSRNPVWNNGFLPGLDIVMLYTILSEVRPNKYIEVGSGNSTKVAFRAKIDGNLSTEIISIDPQPRTEIDELADKVIRKPFENLNFDIVDELYENDILFIDNSHRILPNSDSLVFFLEVLPRLRKGVIVHIHDIYLPFDYPQFMCDRFYSEQYGLAFYLLANPNKFEIIAPNYYLSEKKELSDIIIPVWDQPNMKDVEKHGGSFWLRVKE